MTSKPDSQSASPTTTALIPILFPSFLSKVYVGYLVFSIALIWPAIFILASIALGIAVTGPMLRRFSMPSLAIYIPTTIAILTTLRAFTMSFLSLAMLTFLASILFRFGRNRIKMLAGADQARAFGLSHVGFVVGALLSRTNEEFALGGLALLALHPFLVSTFSRSSLVRAERMHPLVGPVTLWKMFRKQKNPVLPEATRVDAHWDHRNAAEGDVLRFLFAGDTVFSHDQAIFDLDTCAWIRGHHVRALNLEAPIATASTGALAGELLYSTPEALDAFNFKDGSTLFNVFSVINNHCLDQGLEKYRLSLAELEQRALFVVDEQPRVQVVESSVGPVRVGWLARSFGANLPWLQRKIPGAFLNPDTLLGSIDLRRELATQLGALRRQCDLVCFSYHWGYEAEAQPDEMHLQVWKLLRECGVDFVFGHHPHLPHPVLATPDFTKLCLSSAGNLNLNLNLGVEDYDRCVLYSVEFDVGSRSFTKLETRFFRKEDVEGRMVFTRTNREKAS